MTAFWPAPLGILLLPSFSLLSLAAIIEPLRLANARLQGFDADNLFVWHLFSLDGHPVRDGNGVIVSVERALQEDDGLRSLLIIGDSNHSEASHSRDLLNLCRRLARRGVHLGAIGNAANVLAAAGLLDAHQSKVHWACLPGFQERHPDLEADDGLYAINQTRTTSAGRTAALDMTLHVIERVHGRTLAIEVAQDCIKRRIRDSKDRQRMDIPARFGVFHPKLVAALRSIEIQRSGPVRLGELAVQTEMSSRQLLRLFKTHLKSTPAKVQLRMRLERARQLLLAGEIAVVAVATECGFQSASHFSRAYSAEFGVSPARDRASLGGLRREAGPLPSVQPKRSADEASRLAERLPLSQA